MNVDRKLVSAMRMSKSVCAVGLTSIDSRLKAIGRTCMEEQDRPAHDDAI
jgi:hypothetical protein